MERGRRHGGGICMTVTSTDAPTEQEQRQLAQFFDATRPLAQLLATLRSRRVARGYSIESGKPEHRSATGRDIVQDEGPLASQPPPPVDPPPEIEEARGPWPACGPN